MPDEFARLNVLITAKARQALARAVEVTGNNNTDNVSPALVMWAHLQERVFLPGNQLLVRNVRTGKISEITLELGGD